MIPKRLKVDTWFFLVIFLNECLAERAYPLGCSTKDQSYYNYDSYPFPPPSTLIKTTDDYLLVRRLGSGKFSDVFEAVDVQMERNLPRCDGSTVDPRTLVVLKCLKPVSERKIRRELLVLSHASKLPNLARLLAVVVPKQDEIAKLSGMKVLQPMPTLVLEHAGLQSQWLCHGKSSIEPNVAPSSISTVDLFLSEYDIQYYLYHLLVALDALHSCGIMHRDVKPRNVLINRRLGDDDESSSGGPLMLIDLGLADFYLPNTRYNVRVASRHYKSPELLVGYEHYDYAVDIWGVGCILAGLLLRHEPFFRGYVVNKLI
jgi:casein kinase II subunit alpha